MSLDLDKLEDCHERNSIGFTKIKTNLLWEGHKLLKAIISLPRIEYIIESDNFMFTKYLSSLELKSYLESFFQDWDLLCLEQLD
jgi:hypothetical protein